MGLSFIQMSCSLMHDPDQMESPLLVVNGRSWLPESLYLA
jgi:hypothetical protein